MSNKENIDEELYTKNFNLGFLLARFLPEISQEISRGTGKSEAFLALQDGRNQYLSEKAKERLPSWLVRDPGKLPSRVLGKGKDKSIEPEL